MTKPPDPIHQFIEAACVPLDTGHASGTLERANAILAQYPDLATATIHTAAILGDQATVQKFLAIDPANATTKSGPYDWDALTHLCFSRYLRLDRARSDGFVNAARALLDGGADPNTGWFEKNHQPQPGWESVLYGAAGIAHHADLTRLLLERGADPNDGEVAYHTPETFDNDAMKVLVESGKLNDQSLATLLLRKTDWHDLNGIKWLLEHGVQADAKNQWGKTPLHNAVLSENAFAIIEALLDHGANPTLPLERPDTVRLSPAGKSSIAIAARKGRGDLLQLFAQRGFPIDLQGHDRLLAACATNDTHTIRAIAKNEPQLVNELLANGATTLSEFACIGNTEGVRHLLDLGIDVNAANKEGNGYLGIAKNSTALHVAAWRARHATLKLLIERGANVNASDDKNQTPLILAIRACVDSFWTDRRSPESIEALLRAGASTKEIKIPTGYKEADELIKTVS